MQHTHFRKMMHGGAEAEQLRTGTCFDVRTKTCVRTFLCRVADPRRATTTMSAGLPSAPLDDLIAVLGGSVDRSTAQRLLSDAGGSLETAANIYFSGAGPSGARGSSGPAGKPAGKLQQLRSLLGDGAGSPRRLQRLLEASKGSVEGAIELHFSGGWIVGEAWVFLGGACRSLKMLKACQDGLWERKWLRQSLSLDFVLTLREHDHTRMGCTQRRRKRSLRSHAWISSFHQNAHHVPPRA